MIIPPKDELNVPADMSVFADVSNGTEVVLKHNEEMVPGDENPFLAGGSNERTISGDADAHRDHPEPAGSTDGAVSLSTVPNVIIIMIFTILLT